MKEHESTNSLTIEILRNNLQPIDVFSVTALDVRLQTKYPSVRDQLIRLQSKEISFQNYTRLTAQSDLGILISAFISGKYELQELEELNWILSSQDIDFITKTWKTISALVLEQFERFKNSLNKHKIALQEQAANIDQMRSYFLSQPFLLKQLTVFAGFLSQNHQSIYETLIAEQAKEIGYEHATYIYPHSRVGVAIISVCAHQDPSIIQYIIPRINDLIILEILNIWEVYEFELALEAKQAPDARPNTFPRVQLTTAANNFVHSSLEEIEQARQTTELALLEHQELEDLGTQQQREFIAYALLFYPSIDDEEIITNLRLPADLVRLFVDYVRSMSLNKEDVDQELEELGLIKS